MLGGEILARSASLHPSNIKKQKILLVRGCRFPTGVFTPHPPHGWCTNLSGTRNNNEVAVYGCLSWLRL